jgi:hypothetical protein
LDFFDDFTLSAQEFSIRFIFIFAFFKSGQAAVCGRKICYWLIFGTCFSFLSQDDSSMSVK